MDIKRTTHDYIELSDGITISVSSKAPDPRPAHTRVVNAIIEAVGKIEGSDKPDKPTYDAVADTGQMTCSEGTEADPELEGEPTVNQSAPMIESKPKLLVDIAKSTDSSEGAVKMISLTFRNLYEVFDRDEERAMCFVECICVMLGSDVLVISMDNGQVIIAEDHTRRSTSYDGLVELAKQAIARVATVAGIDYVVSAR